MAKGDPITDEKREEIRKRIRELHAEGKSRNFIAKALGRSGRTISEEAGHIGISFAARAGQVAAATEVRQADLADRRAAFAIKLQDIAEREAAKISQPLLYWDWGGKEHDFDTHLAPEPTPADKRALMGTVATALDRSLKLVPPKDESGVEEGLALITQLMSGLTAVYQAQQQDQEADEGA
ncbi:helix-turn-helix domain-containing protein [Streptomyces fimicarius]|uniref:helix-turn-helix domain-containing protein n=1 Tax=Streptomyces griseus TaxID=1911 RepID=UPI0035DC61CF